MASFVLLLYVTLKHQQRCEQVQRSIEIGFSPNGKEQKYPQFSQLHQINVFLQRMAGKHPPSFTEME